MKRASQKTLKTGILLTGEDLIKTAKELVNWKIEDGKLHRQYSFGSFPKAFAFLAGAALISESMHHPIEWYNMDRFVAVKLQTPSVGGISTIDVLLAKKLDELN
jgi:4a-hydroxytetrahydrobiopterin dehydratase